MTSLIAEDDATSRLMLKEILRPYGTVQLAVNGREAVEAAQAAFDSGQPYDLICLDVMMPEMDGMAALRAIRDLEKDRGIPATDACVIFMITAVTNEEHVARAIHERASAYLVKPINPNRLLRKLAASGLTG